MSPQNFRQSRAFIIQPPSPPPPPQMKNIPIHPSLRINVKKKKTCEKNGQNIA